MLFFVNLQIVKSSAGGNWDCFLSLRLLQKGQAVDIHDEGSTLYFFNNILALFPAWSYVLRP